MQLQRFATAQGHTHKPQRQLTSSNDAPSSSIHSLFQDNYSSNMCVNDWKVTSADQHSYHRLLGTLDKSATCFERTGSSARPAFSDTIRGIEVRTKLERIV